MVRRGSWWFSLIIFLIVLAILIKLNLLSPIKDWVFKTYVFPEQCKKVYPGYYRHVIYDYCNLKKYNLTEEDIIVKTYYTDETCNFIVYIRDKEVYNFSLKYKGGKYIKCEDLIQKWLSK